MKVRRWSFCCFAVVALACVAQGGNGAGDWATSALRNGTLTVWRITGTPAPAQRAALDIGYHEQSAGSFGQSAGSAGTAASNAGTAAGGFGTAASDIGQTSSSYGQTSGSFGQAAGNTGRPASNYGRSPSALGPGPGSASASAGDYGQTSGSFGDSLSTINQPGSRTARRTSTTSVPADHIAEQASMVLGEFRALQMNVVSVAPNEVAQKLAQAEGTDAYPDVLLVQGWRGDESWISETLTPLGSSGIAQPADLSIEHAPEFQSVILRRAPHPETAKAFVVWLSDERLHPINAAKFQDDSELADAVATAIRASRSVLFGGKSFAEADKEFAEFSAMTPDGFTSSPHSLEMYHARETRIDVMEAAANDQLAIVALRIVGSSWEMFGVVHPFVVLRRSEGGEWKVLHLSLNRAPNLLRFAFTALSPNAMHAPKESTEAEKGSLAISQASPPNGDSRSRFPELWWDNGGGATLLVVEWQVKVYDNAWSDSHIDFVPDTGSHTQTRAVANFAYRRGSYRWRVWSVGKNGAMQLSPWRNLGIVS